MKDKIMVIEVIFRKLLQRIEKLKNIPLSYEVLVKVQKVKVKIEELGDLISVIEVEEEE